MILIRMIALPVAALLFGAAAPPPSPAMKDIDPAVQRIYGHYSRDSADNADWALPVFSAAATAQIKVWQKHIGNNLTSLNDYGWFCECQDWDAKAFRAKRISHKVIDATRLEIVVLVTVGEGVSRRQRLNLVLEKGRWMVDDLFSGTVPKGMRADIKRELAIPKNRL